jgi:hypothetical protein
LLRKRPPIAKMVIGGHMENFDEAILEKWLDKGLCSGSGDGKSAVCLEQAVALCAGLPLTDSPNSCVHPSVSAFGRRLNDARWSSPKARSAGLREFAFAQLGTSKIDGKAFTRRLAELTIREIVPIAPRAAAKRNPKHSEGLTAATMECEKEGTIKSARSARKIADDATCAYADDATCAYAAAYVADAAASVADAAAVNAYGAAAYVADAAAYVADAAAVNAYGAAAYAAAYAARDKILSLSAGLAVRVLNELRQ